MSSGFKKFLDVSGKSADEIRENINKMLNNAVSSVVETVVDDVTQFLPNDLRRQIKKSVHDACENPSGSARETREYKAEKIPPRQPAALPEDFIPPPPSPPPPSYNPNAFEYPREPICEPQNEQEEFMINKIREMRKLGEVTHNSYVVKRCAEVTMVQQGEFMADVTDDFPRTAFCAIQRPIYASMSNSQLRTYFTWRTEWRKGNYDPTDKPYVLLYCYEVLNKIGFKDSDDAFRGLMTVWNELSASADYLRALLPRWIMDFCAYNNVSLPTPVFEGLSPYDGDVSEILDGNFKGKFGFLAEHSAYAIKESKFFSEQTRPLLEGACDAVLEALAAHFGKYGIELSALLCGKLRRVTFWEPFGSALVDLDRMDGFHTFSPNAAERYCVKRGEPSLEQLEFFPSKHLIGYVLKSIEARIRKAVGFPHALSPNINMLKTEIANREKFRNAVTDPDFEKLIRDAADLWCRQNGISKKTAKGTPPPEDIVIPVVEIDISKLAMAREQAELNASRLIVPDTAEEYSPFETGESAESSAERDEPSVGEPDFERIADSIYEDEFSEAVAEYAENASPPELPKPNREVLDALSGDWQDLAAELTPTQIKALGALLEGSIAQFCRAGNIFAETIFEQINSAALEAVGDVVIESGEIVEDYRGEVSTLVKAFG